MHATLLCSISSNAQLARCLRAPARYYSNPENTFTIFPPLKFDILGYLYEY